MGFRTPSYLRIAALRVAAVAGSCRGSERGNDKQNTSIGTPLFHESKSERFLQGWTSTFHRLTRPSVTLTEGVLETQAQPKRRYESYDFIVIGCGNAGRSAIEHLRKVCPKARIAVVDSLRPCHHRGVNQYKKNRVVGLSVDDQTVELDDEHLTTLRYNMPC